MNRKFDVVVLGASLAGSTVASFLAQHGASVALIDATEFPRRKPCGEGLSSICFPVLQELGVLNAVRKNTPAVLSGYRICDGKHSLRVSQQALLPRNSEPFLGIERFVLDTLIVERALSYQTVCGYFGVKPQYTFEPSQHTFQIGTRTVSGRYLVVADGVHSSIANYRNIPTERDKKLRYGMSFVAQGRFNSPVNDVTIVVHKDIRNHAPDLGYEVFFTPVGKDRLNVAILSDKEVSRHAFSHSPEVLLELARSHVGFHGDVLREPLGRGPLCHQVRPAFYGDSTFLVGDAVETFDPIGGLGMTHALYSGALCAKGLIRALEWRPHWKTSPQLWYAAERRRRARKFHWMTLASYFSMKTAVGRSLGKTLLRPWLNAESLPLLRTETESAVSLQEH